MNSILVVCMGNICRSPTAEAVFRHKARTLGLDLKIDSAGTIGYHTGESPDPRSVQAGQARGYDFSDMRARQIGRDDLQKFDLILAADRQNLLDIQSLASKELSDKIGLMLQWGKLEEDEVPDPYYGGDGGFDHVLDLIESSAEALLCEIALAKG
ncbi:low molecular weight protein-tyrosine-phosphatase [Ferrimonas pelagia]|uniref:low molecular weight protein-tyrosine-phosphatase n=1 Tax=Ferrimonas pelagia TaxID=1177826 RepID=UPI0031F18C6B